MHQEEVKHRCLLMSRCTLSLCWSSVTAPAASSLLLWRSNLHPQQLLTLVLTCRRDTGLSFGKAASAPGLLLLLPWLFVELLLSGQRLMRSKGLPGTMKP